MLKKWREYYLIKRSGLFDPVYYLLNYPDVRNADVDPLLHFIKVGWKEGRRPSSKFDQELFLNMHPELRGMDINPLLFFLKNEKEEEKSKKLSLKKIVHFIRRGVPFLLKLKGIVFFAGYPYPEREKDGYYQRIRSVDTLFIDRWRIYIDNVRLPGRETWYDRPAPFTLVLRPYGSGEQEWVKRLCVVLCVLRCRVIYFHSVLSIGTIDFLWRLPGIRKIIDIHGAVPEEFRYQGDLVSAEHFNNIERSVVSKAQYIIVVSEAMRHHIEDKYSGTIGGQFITLPIFQDIFVYQSEKPYVNGKPVIIYAGGLQKWQQVPKMVNAMTSTLGYYNYKFYCPDPKEVLTMLPENLRKTSSLEIGSKSFGEISEVYRDCHYGFILREDIIVNHVACPTKLIEYLANGIVPIVDCEDIGDFKVMGMKFIHLGDLLKNKLPDESIRKDMAKINFYVFEKLLEKHDIGVSTLKQSIKFSKLRR